MALSTTQYGYIIDPMVPFTDGKGNTIKDGFVRVFVAGSSTPVITYRNFDGAANQDLIELDNSGRTKTSVIGSKGITYKVCVYDQLHSQESPILTVDKVSVIGSNITAGAGATVVTGLDGLTTKPDGFVDASVVGTDGYVALDHTLVTDDLNTDAKVTAVENDRYIPLLNDDVNDPDSKITLGRLWQWVLGKIKSLSTTITAFRTGDVIPVDGPSGTAKMSKDDLLRETAENALVDNLATAFDPTRTNDNVYTPGQVVEYEGGTYMFINSHYGVWASADVVDIDVFGREDYKLKNFINKSVEGNSPIAMQFNNECIVDSSYKLVQKVKSDYSWGGCILSAGNLVRLKLLHTDNYIIVATALSHRFLCLAIGIGGTNNGKWFRFTDTGFVAGSAISSFPVFNINQIEIIRIDDNTIKIDDHNGHSITVDLSTNGLVDINSWWLPCFGIVTSNYYNAGNEYAVILNYGSFSCLYPNFTTQKWIEDKMSKNILSPILKCFSHDVSVDGRGSIVANSYNGKSWGGIVFTEDTLSFKFSPADNYIVLAYQNAPGWSFIAIEVTGSNKGRFVWFYENGFQVGSSVSDFPTLDRNFINVSRTGSTYEISDGSNSVSVQLASCGFLLESFIPAVGLVTSSYYGAPYTYGQITNLSQIASLKFLNNYKKLAGKKIVILGDSITDQGRFTSALAEISGCDVDKSFGVSGSTISSQNNSFIDRISSMPTDVDYVLVFGGVNDWQLGVTLGQFSDGVSDASKFYGACHTMMNALTNKYRNGTINIPILWMTPCHAQFQGATIGGTEYPPKLEYSVTGSGLVANSYGGGILENYVTAIREVAEFYGVEVIDTYSESGLAPLQNSNRTKFFTDGLHPNNAGGMMIAKTVYRKLKDIS